MIQDLYRAHSITTHTSYRREGDMYRYECRCGKKGKYQKDIKLTRRGANAHLRATR